MINSVLCVGCYVEKDGEFLIVQERKCGKWNFPMGRLDPDEGLEEGALRELKEETGVEGKVIGLKKILHIRRIGGAKDGSGEDFYLTKFLFEVELLKFGGEVDPDILSMKWVSMEEFLEMDKSGELRSSDMLAQLEGQQVSYYEANGLES